MRTERIVYDSWTVTCTDTVEKASKKTCSAMLQVIEEKQRQVLLLWVIGRDNQGVLRTVFQSPTGVQIPRGLELKFGNAAARTVPYAACTPQNCEASLAVDDAMIRDARANGEATATIFAVDGRTINFKMGIKGIDKAFAALGKQARSARQFGPFTRLDGPPPVV
jgi:invasion protein IalB